MKWVNVYLVGYVIFIIGVVAALAKSGVIQRVGTGWTVIGVVIAIGIGIMMSISSSGRKETIEIDRH